MKLIVVIVIKWVKRLLGIKSPSMEFIRIYGPIIRKEMDEYMAYIKEVLEMLESEDETAKRL